MPHRIIRVFESPPCQRLRLLMTSLLSTMRLTQTNVSRTQHMLVFLPRTLRAQSRYRVTARITVPHHRAYTHASANARHFSLDAPQHIRYTSAMRPSGGMADAAVSKTVVFDVRVRLSPRAPSADKRAPEAHASGARRFSELCGATERPIMRRLRLRCRSRALAGRTLRPSAP